MAFWTDYGVGTLEPKRSYRFLLFFGQLSTPWIAKKVTKPGFAISETKHSYLNHNFYYPGRVEWNTVTATLVDPGDPDVAQTMDNILRNSGYLIPEGPDSAPVTLSKGASVRQMNTVRIQQIQNDYSGDSINPSNVNVVEEWQLYGAWVKDVKFGDLAYEDDNLTEVTVELRYDYARLNDANGTSNVSAPTPVTRDF
tara:strand:- start:930 stop:1520 length:591 start_codon:yes stop_codon:yes gene_type:complete